MTVLKGQRRDSTPTQAQPEVFQSIIQITASEKQIHWTLFGYLGFKAEVVIPPNG